MHICILVYLHTWMIANLQTCRLADLNTCRLAYMHTCILRQEFATLSSRRDGPNDCCDLSFFQRRGKLKYARCHPFYRFFMEVVPLCLWVREWVCLFAYLLNLQLLRCCVIYILFWLFGTLFGLFFMKISIKNSNKLRLMFCQAQVNPIQGGAKTPSGTFFVKFLQE